MLLLGCDKAENKRENYARDGKQQTHTHINIMHAKKRRFLNVM